MATFGGRHLSNGRPSTRKHGEKAWSAGSHWRLLWRSPPWRASRPPPARSIAGRRRAIARRTWDTAEPRAGAAANPDTNRTESKHEDGNRKISRRNRVGGGARTDRHDRLVCAAARSELHSALRQLGGADRSVLLTPFDSKTGVSPEGARRKPGSLRLTSA